jgi:glutathione S-transferase
MALTIYGSAQSRTMRVLWAAAELGLRFRHVPLAWDDPALKEPAFLKINPAGQVPAIVDDGFALSESLAITLYLAKKTGSPLHPTSPHDEARTWSWTLWATYELESLLHHDVRRPPVPQEAAPAIASALAHLEGCLSREPYLLGQAFTVADLNVAAVLSPSRQAIIQLEPFPAVRDWLARCYGRPACVEARARHLNPGRASRPAGSWRRDRPRKPSAPPE